MQADCSVPYPDPIFDEETTDWITLHSLVSLNLTLESIIRHCMTPHTLPLNEFPLKTEVDSPLTQYASPLRTFPSRVRLYDDQMTLKMAQLKTTMKLYEQRVHELHQGSREFFGDVRGQSIFLLIDTSEVHGFGIDQQNEESKTERDEFVEYKRNVQQLFKEQLSHKKNIYLSQLGSDESEGAPTNLNFTKHKERSMMIARQWIDSMEGSGDCSLLKRLESVQTIATSIDTLLIVIGSRPSDDSDTIVNYIKDRFTGSSKLHIHLVAHGCSKETREILVKVASETEAQYHSYCKSTSTGEQLVKDSEIDTLTAQLEHAQKIYSELERLSSGIISETVMPILIQLNIAHCQFGDDSTTTDNLVEQLQCLPVSSTEWLKDHSLTGEGLSIYSVLAGNAYPQLNNVVVHSPDKHTLISSVVYDDAMLQFTWHDGTQKYLHVDVHLLEKYQIQMEAYIVKLQQRLNWLVSGSRASFGVITEKSVLLVMEFSSATLPYILQLHNSMQCLLNEQVSHCKEFDIIRVGSEDCCTSWQHGFTQPTKQSISEAWVWLLSQSPSRNSASLIPALEKALTGDTYCRERDVGVYLILNSMPKENLEEICSFLCEKTAQMNISVHVIQYQYSPPTINHTIAPLSFDEEKCYVANDELTQYLKQIASAGKGRFHSFKGPNNASGNDIDHLIQELTKAQDHLKMARKILNDYRTFCKRCVPTPLPPASLPPRSEPPPLYPRTNTTFLSRLNATTSRRITRSASDSHLSHRQIHTLRHHTRRTKTHSFYLNSTSSGKASAEQIAHSPKKAAQNIEFRSISEWLLKYSLESLGLNFSRLEVQKHNQKLKKTYKHINKKGEIRELYTNHYGLKHFLQRVKQVRDKYLTKLGELSKGWHRFYGCVTESKVLFLIDVSSSMTGCFDEMQTALINLLQNRPHILKHFNMMAYSSSVTKWQESLAPVTSENVDTAIQWLRELKPDGSSCLLHALKLSLDSGAKNIYIITDGTADHTHDFLISQLPQLRVWYGNDWKINTIAYHCTLDSSYRFMKTLAHNTNGRYHSYPWDPALSPSRLLQDIYLGDDIRRLAQEIVTADDYIQKASCYL